MKKKEMKKELAKLRLFALKVEKTFEYCKKVESIMVDNIQDHLKNLKGE
jgi:hypothetical protein